MTEDCSRWLRSFVALSTLVVAGCAAQARYYSSAVDYLYPGKAEPVDSPEIPVMSLPMRVGIAFVPDIRSERQRTFWQEMGQGRPPRPGENVLTENQKYALMREVSDQFLEYPYIGSIEVIPAAYLTPG